MSNHQNNAEIVLALDIGGTFIKSALFRSGELFHRLEPVPSRSEGNREAIAAAFRQVIRQAGKFDHLAVAVPGPFDYEHGIFRMPHKFAAVNGRPFAELSGREAACFLHDANAFLLGEMTHGAARGFSRCGGITLGTGLGAAFASGGEIRTGCDGSPAPEVKLWNRPFRGKIAEDFISARALLARFPAGNVREIAERAKAGDPAAKQLWLEYGAALFELLSQWQEQLSPEVIVIGGGIGCDLALFGALPAGLPLRKAELGEDAALYGAYESFLKGGLLR